MNASAATLRRSRIDALEVLEDRAPLLGRQTTKLVPARLAELLRVSSVRGRVLRSKKLRIRRGLGFALVAVLTLVLLERTTRVEESPEELLLARYGVGVDAAAV